MSHRIARSAGWGIALLLIAAPTGGGAATSIQVNVAPDGANIVGDAANEPSIAVDPRRPDHLVIGWRQFDTVNDSFREAGYAFSHDGGRTWTFPGSVDEGAFRSDPVLCFDADGYLYYQSMLFVPPPDVSRTCHVFRSRDSGTSWEPGVFAWGGDKPWMTVDRTEGIGRGNIYLTWNPILSQYGSGFFTRSTDRGISFEPPVTPPVRPGVGTVAVDPDGAVFLAGRDMDGYDSSDFMVARSTDAQDPNRTPTFGGVQVHLGGAFIPTHNPAAPNPDGYMGQIWIACDHSTGPLRGNVYVLASVDPPGIDPADVYFIRSEDGGGTWSRPLRVNDDPVTNGAWQWFGMMSVAPTGRIDAVWNDTRNSAFARISELYYACSYDGGMSWSANQRLSTQWDSHLGFPGQDKIGDYYDMVSDAVGAHVAWAATFNGEQDIYYLRIGDYDCNANGISDQGDIMLGISRDENRDGIPDECQEDLLAVAPHEAPALALACEGLPGPEVRVTWRLPAAAHATLAVHDVAGRRVETLFDGVRPAGVGTLAWRGPAASGVYFIRLSAAGRQRTLRIALLR